MSAVFLSPCRDLMDPTCWDCRAAQHLSFPVQGGCSCGDIPAFSAFPRDQQRCGDHGRAVLLLRERLCQRDGDTHGPPGHQTPAQLRTLLRPCARSGSESRALLLPVGWEPLRNCWSGRNPVPLPTTGCSTSLVVRLGGLFL